MSRLALRVVALAGLAASTSACTRRSPPHATAVDAQRANIELADLQQGRKLLLAKCAGCHATPLPNDHTAAEWPRLIDDMVERAKIDANQRALIERYMIVMRDHTP